MMGTTPDRVRQVSIGDAETWARQVGDENLAARMRQSARKAGLET